MADLLALTLGAFLLVVGLTHFLVPRYYDRLVPPWLPRARVWVLVSGAGEILVGAGLLSEVTRPSAAWAATGLIAVYVATHVDGLLRARREQASLLDRPLGAVARVVVNVGYLAWAATVAASV